MKTISLILFTLAHGTLVQAKTELAVKSRLDSLPFVEVNPQNWRKLIDPNNDHFQHFSNRVKEKRSLKNKMSQVRDQGKRGTCSVFAATALIESLFGDVNFSEQCLALFSSDSDSGSTLQRIEWAFENPLYWDDDCKYDKRENGRNTIPNLERAEKAFISEFASFMSYRQEKDEALDFIRDFIKAGDAVTISVYTAGGDWDYTGIIDIPSTKAIRAACQLNPKSSKPECRSHAVLVTGFNDEEQYLEFKNSWGENWPITGPLKNTGYGKLSYAYFEKMKTSNSLVTAWRTDR